MLKKAIVYYHDNCADGFGAAWVFKNTLHSIYFTLRAPVEYRPISYGTEIDVSPTDFGGADVYILDFSFSEPIIRAMCKFAADVVLIDHHKTAIDKLDNLILNPPENLKLILDVTQSGAALTWDYFNEKINLPSIDEFTNGPSIKPTPDLIKYIQDRDLWKFELPDSATINVVIQNTDKNFDAYNELDERLSEDRKSLVRTGRYLLRQQNQLVEQIVAEAVKVRWVLGNPTFILDEVPVVMCPPMLASEVGNRLANISGTFGATYHTQMVGDVKHKKYSLRSVGDYDVAEIAEYFEGGGHKNAAGFVVPWHHTFNDWTQS